VTGWLDALVRDHEVHLWHVDPAQVADERLLAAYRALLSPAEHERTARFVFEKGRHESLVTRALVRTTLSIYQPEVDPRAWQFIANPYGRPEIAVPSCPLDPRFLDLGFLGLRFNVSHTDGRIVCLVAVGREIGVDVEDAARRAPLEVADHYFSPSEVAELRSLPEAARPGRFFDYWTLKESYIKARGLGLQLPLDQFSFHLGANEVGPGGLGPGGLGPVARRQPPPITISFGPQIADDPATWQFDLRDLTPRHRLAIAIRRAADEPDLAIRVIPVVPLSSVPRPPTRS
jgi:4'-phosphopantetheinyl transferase